MFKSKKLLVLLSMVLVFALFAVGCSQPADTTPDGDTEQPAGDVTVKDTLIVAQGGDPASLDPHATNDQPSARVMKHIYNTLVTQNQQMEVVPALAESWEVIDDLTYEFKLRQDVKFHNGEDFTANDVKFTLLRAKESNHIGHIVGAIDPEGIEIIDDYTIRISTEKPFAPLLAHLSHTASSILNEKAVTEGGEDYGQNPVGTGPFKFVNWVTGDSIELERYDGYHDGPAKMAKVTFRAIVENTTRTIELETGGIDIAYDIQPQDVSRVEGNSDLNLIRGESFTTGYIGFNAAKKPFDDVRVRQAINYAIDIDSIVEAVFQGVGTPAKGPLGPNVWASHQGLEPYGYNVEKAKELMAEAGLADGFKTTIWTNENQQRMDISEIIQNQLRAINIDVEVKVMEWGAYLDGTAAGEHDMFILGWVTVTGDPDYGLYALFHSAQHGAAGNRTFYTNTRVDELLDSARVETDPSMREKFYLEAQEIIRNDAPWIFNNNGENIDGLRKNVKGYMQHPAGHHYLYNVYFE
ncbi:glutathione ABC transporter substrate-binding protein [Alkaliphilus peptidifermentans]|uniref:Peptide/nickel transport system substrate-binding protein n=1 Tax=Alkaliphilus peptidifermentans DSM 18978 TaxID=1120976 RepID=A0A1G5BI22_9FIRM|nr:glutathione ABC transporter substrate-binding protein [Alkaliphilus peptidifermentans]SCX89769.1 peptide/nickel transport system substrate-binding protein [Alkaliphilus peptidifermentans DSM 18978]